MTALDVLARPLEPGPTEDRTKLAQGAMASLTLSAQGEHMATIQKILFPVDFSPACDAMAPFVQRVAAMFSAKVTLLYVLEPSTSGFEVLTRPVPHAEEDRKKLACAKLETYLTAEFPLHEIPRLLVAGEAAARIAEVASGHGFE